jgi:hypothetical protein
MSVSNGYLDEHFFYEISLLQYTRDELRLIKSIDNKSNVLIESFVLHSRNLIDFFITVNSKKQDDDVIASDFNTQTNNWINNLNTYKSYLQRIKTRANKELAHLTSKRKSGATKDKAWDFEKIYLILYEIIVTYTNELEDTVIRSSLQTKFKQIGFSH